MSGSLSFIIIYRRLSDAMQRSGDAAANPSRTGRENAVRILKAVDSMKAVAFALVFAIGCGSSPEANAAGDVAAISRVGEPRRVGTTDELKTAEAAIAQGHPWKATQLMAPLLRDPKRRTPAAIVIAARAAAGWGGWAEVDKLLSKEPWLDRQFEGEGRELLTRSAFERGADTIALTHASAALHDATTKQTRAVRTVLLARALERNNMFDSAAVLYLRAAESLRPIREWLLLRAAGNQSDSTARAKTLAAVTLAVARPRVGWTDAQARERFSDALGAAERFATLGSKVNAFRLRLSVAADSATRSAIKTEVIAYIRAHSGSVDAKNAVDALDRAFTSLTPAEELVIARSAAASGPAARAVVAYGRALAQPSMVTSNDRLQYGLALSRAGRSRDALVQLDAVEGALAAQAAYQRARVLLTSAAGDVTRAALRNVVAKFPADSSAASAALFLLADLSTDDGKDDDARTLYRRLYHSYPTSARAANARFNAAIIAFANGEAKLAAAELDSLVVLKPRSDDATAARYWSGRAWAAAGNPTLARARWTDVIAQQPASYYAGASARRLGDEAWRPPARADSFTRFPAIDSALARVKVLERLGMDAEARFEYDALDASAGATPERMAATAHAFLEHGQPSRAIRLAQRLVDSGQRDARAYRLLFPVLDRDELTRDAKARGLDPALVAGLIRQESNFNEHAVSAANARGLMQVLPSVGEETARSLSYPVWYPALLTDGDANLQLGTAHLATYMKQYGPPLPRVLAAYNAGGSRVTRWVTKAGVDDPELFAERIPFAETRDYVRLVQRNADIYRALYDW
jgi:soluble lytic murein transglycosylase